MSQASLDHLHARQDAGADRLLILAENVATRLCHDVAGLVATIAGTLEMALEDGAADSEAAVLSTEAASLLAARVRLYRAAWGGGDMEQDGIAALAEGLPNRARLNLAIDPALSDGHLPPPGPRLMLCVLLAATASLPTGGDITVCAAECGFSVRLAGRNAAWNPAITRNAAEAASGLETVDARALAVPLAALVAAAAGWCIKVDGMRLTALPA